VSGTNATGAKLGTVSGSYVRVSPFSNIGLPFIGDVTLLRSYGWYRFNYGGLDTTQSKFPYFHAGVDMAAENSSVVASGDGKVVFIKKDTDKMGYGNQIAILYKQPGNPAIADVFQKYADLSDSPLSDSQVAELTGILSDPDYASVIKGVQDSLGDEYQSYNLERLKSTDETTSNGSLGIAFKNPKTYVLYTNMWNTGRVNTGWREWVRSSDGLNAEYGKRVTLPHGLGTVEWNSENEWKYVCEVALNYSYWANPSEKNKNDVKGWRNRMLDVIAYCDANVTNMEMVPTHPNFDSYVYPFIRETVYKWESGGDYTLVLKNDPPSNPGAAFSFGASQFHEEKAKVCLSRIAEAIRGGELAGRTVILFYAHLASINSRLVVNSVVSSGEQIGVQGSTGLTDVPHLHLSAAFVDEWNTSKILSPPTASENPNNSYFEMNEHVDFLSGVLGVKNMAEFVSKFPGSNWVGSENPEQTTNLANDQVFVVQNEKYATQVSKSKWGG
jgi:hypothetical protein